MISHREADWGPVRASIVKRARLGETEQRFRLPWHTFRMSLAGRFGKGSTTRLAGDPSVPMPTSHKAVSFYPAGTDIRNSVTSASAMTYLIVEIEPELSDRIVETPGFLDFRAAIDLDSALTRQLIDGLSDAIENKDPTQRLFVETTALMLLLEAARQTSRVPASPERQPQGGLAPYHLNRVTDFILDHLADEISLKELAALVDLSPSHLCRAFKRSTGTTTHRWQTEKRIGRARDLMLTTETSLASIADATGFADQSHFTTVFRKAEGVTPHEWRRRNRR